MNNFVFNTPTRVVFGRGVEKEVGRLVREFGGSRVLLHFGGGSVERSGLLGRIRESLQEHGLTWVELGGVVPNPRLSKIHEGIELGRKEGVDFILAVGGGSVIDSAKAIGYGLANGGEVWDLFEKKRKATGCAPVGAVLTISAAGSEMSSSCVVTREEGWIKRGYTSEFSRPRFAVMNPELTLTLSDWQTACGCVDILMHTMERYFHRSGGMELTDGIAETLLKTVMKNALVLRDDPSNYDARAEVMWAGSLSHNGLTGCGTDGGDWACHKIEHELSGLFDVSHGAGLSAVWGHALSAAFSNFDVVLLLLFTPNFKGSLSKCFWGWALLTVVMVEYLVMLLTVGLGDFAASQMFPFYSLAAFADLSIFQRLDSLHITLWTFIAFVKVSVYLYFASQCLGYLVPRRLKKTRLAVAGILTAAGALVISSDLRFLTAVQKAMATGIPVAVLAVLIPFVLLLWSLIARRKERAR